MTQSKLTRAAAIAAALIGLGDVAAQAGGFALREGSAAAQGASLAGRTSGDRDVSYILHNPAALRGVEGLEVSSGIAAVVARGDAVTGAAFGGLRSTGDPNETGLVPSLAVGYRLNDTLAFGLGVRAPFGLATEYSEFFIGAFDGVKSELVTIAVTPMVAVNVLPGVTLAGGITGQYADAELTNRVGLGPNDIASVKGDDIGFGFTLGALVDITADTTLGASFIYGIGHKLEGRFSSNFISPIGPLSGSGAASFDLPSIISLGITHRLGERLRIMAEGEYADWSQYDAITFVEDASGGTFQDPQDYKDSFLVSVGAEYDVSDRLTIRGGLAFDDSPVRDSARTTRVPDADRAWVSLGLSYAITERIGLDAAYTYIRIEDTSATFRNGPAAGQRVSYDSEAHVVGMNVRYTFW